MPGRKVPSGRDVPVPHRWLSPPRHARTHSGMPVFVAQQSFVNVGRPMVEQQGARQWPEEGQEIEDGFTHEDQVISIPPTVTNTHMTTLVIRNVSRRIVQDDVLAYWPFYAFNYDLLYMGFDLKKNQAAGIVFINFNTQADAATFFNLWHGLVCPLMSRTDCHGTMKPLAITPARVQGFLSNAELWKRTLRHDVDDTCLPAAFIRGQRVDWNVFVQSMRADAPSATASLGPSSKGLAQAHSLIAL